MLLTLFGVYNVWGNISKSQVHLYHDIYISLALLILYFLHGYNLIPFLKLGITFKKKQLISHFWTTSELFSLVHDLGLAVSLAVHCKGCLGLFSSSFVIQGLFFS